MIRDTRAMMLKIADREKRHAALQAWGPATAIWVYALTKGVSDVRPEQFNPFVSSSESNSTPSKARNMGSKLTWMSKETAQGIVLAAEKKLLPTVFWLKISSYWYDILATAGE